MPSPAASNGRSTRERLRSELAPRALTPSKRLTLSPAGPMVLHAPSVCGEPVRQAQGKLRSLPALNKGQSEKSDWPFPFCHSVIFLPALASATISIWQPPSKLKAGELTRCPLAAVKRRLPRKRPCGSFTPASKKPNLARKSPREFLRKSSTPLAESWLSRSGRPEMPDAVPTANTCWIEWTNGTFLRPWR